MLDDTVLEWKESEGGAERGMLFSFQQSYLMRINIEDRFLAFSPMVFSDMQANHDWRRPIEPCLSAVSERASEQSHSSPSGHAD